MMSTPTSRPDRCLLCSWACGLALLCLLLLTPGAMAQAGVPSTGQASAEAQAPVALAMLQQCITASAQSERSAVFSGEMNAVPGSTRMMMKIDVQEQLAGETLFHTIAAPGLGVWRSSDSDVKSYRFIHQVTNLSAPGFYRALVSFRWLNARDHAVKTFAQHTPRCVQPIPAPPVPAPVTPSTALVSGSLE
jgi:hypothetical protein